MDFRYLLSLILLILSMTTSESSQSQESSSQTHEVEIRLFLIDIESIDTVAQSFTANLTMVSRWNDRELVHDGPNSISMSLDDIWHPRIQILNQQRLVSTLPERVEVYPDGKVVQRQRFWGSFSQPLDLRDFPFDSQILQLKLANVGFGEAIVKLTASPTSGLSKSLTMPDWQVNGWDFLRTDFSIEGESDLLAGMVFSLDVTRDGSYFRYKVIFPLILIVMMSWLVFWIDPSLAASQISVSVTAMLTMIAYRFALAGMMPRLAFLTSLDHFVLASTLIVFLAMIEVIYTAYLSTNGQLEQARRVDRTARWLAPLIYFAIAAETLIFKFWL